MIDPISAIGLASSAFSVVKKAIAAGKEVHEVGSQLGKFFSAASNFRETAQQASKPPLFKKLLHKDSIEKEALDIILHNKKLQEMEKELYELILYTYGAETYRDMMMMRRKIKEDRENQERLRIKRQKQAIQYSIMGTVIVIILTVSIWGMMLGFSSLQNKLA